MTKWIAADLGALGERYAYIARAIKKHGIPAPRTSKPELRTLISLIIQQQVSTGAARAINAKFDEMFPGAKIDAILAANDLDLRAIGLSGQKVKYVRDLVEHVADGRIDIAALKKLDDSEIVMKLTAVKGIGRWTAENYMLFALQRRNIWPAHDMALQEGMRRLKKLEERPNAKLMDVLGTRYDPHRSAMALFGWHYYGATKPAKT